jgi:bacteriocin biosynthesis cyclodehydratase domain-containing protein
VPSSVAHDTAVARPLLKPALRRLWRDAGTVQLGLAPQRAVVLSGLGADARRVLALLDGTRDTATLTADAEQLGLTADDVRRLVDTLAAAGALDDASAASSSRDEHERQLLEPDRLSLSVRHPAPGAADAVLLRRRNAAVTVHGAGRVGSTVAALLGAAGIGLVACVDPVGLRTADLSPGGVNEMRGVSRGAAAAERVRTVAGHTQVQTEPLPDADLTVVAPASPSALPEVLAAVRDRPHLLVSVRETTAVVGPFVLPGRTSCLRCVEVSRVDRDPRWPALAAQLASSTRTVDPCEVPLATVAAGVAVVHALAWLDTGELPPSAGGVVEIEAADARSRRRTLPPHPACGCGAAG